MVFQGVNFNEQWAASKTVEELIKHESHHGLTESQLKEAHALCVKKMNSDKSVKKNESVK